MVMLHDNLIQLPAYLDVADVVTLGTQLRLRYLAVAQPKKHPAEGAPVPAVIAPAVSASWKRLDADLLALDASISVRIATVHAPASNTDAEAANEGSDGAWRTLEQWLGAWATQPDDGAAPTGSDAAVLYARLFPKAEGMQFVRWRPRRQWSAMVARMAVLDKEATVALVEGLGGARMLQRLRDTHAAFGAAYGYTAVRPDAEEDVDLRPQFAAAKDSLRAYLKRVDGSADPDVPGSESLAAWLMAPFHALVDEHRKRDVGRAKPAAKPATPPVTAPVTTPR